MAGILRARGGFCGLAAGFSLWCAMAFALLSPTHQTNAQAQCGFVESLIYPIDTSTFQVAQDFAVPSVRHQGRYHTGEDWYAGRASNHGIGTPVRAIAAGRVTFASTIGWGRDGGVVVIEHTFPDGSIAYSQYGHMVETDNARFPVQWSCISQGAVIGAIGDVRPAPHLHFEIKTSDGTSPGPGYNWEEPVSVGWRKPAKFIQNWNAWLQAGVLWRFDLADESGPISPPLSLDDNSLLYLDANRLGRASPDGRSLWRINLERPAVGLTFRGADALVVYADGSMQRVNRDGTLAERWETGLALDSAPLALGETVLFHTPENALVSFGADRQSVQWTLPQMPPLLRGAQAAGLNGVVTQDNRLLVLSPGGELLNATQFSEPASVTTDPQGVLMAYTQSGLWRFGSDGTWQSALADTVGGRSAALTWTADGQQLFLFDGRVLRAYSRDLALLWQVELPPVTGLTTLTDYAAALLLTSNHGHIIALQKTTGNICGSTRIYGDDRARAWHHLGTDGVLRVAVADQLLGLDWARFLGGCA